ncbi:class I SAM-dependent methyltransferase [Kitasatospora sp. NPDC096077]|uniref:class I SAM-dependent methyltransferase n=1 Tax=Kitasatospora sp. NPDC096077 TaxID=3155544 RepID=UPI0033177E99
MDNRLRVRELILGIEGMALLRNAVGGDEAFLKARVEEIRRFATQDDEPMPDAEAEIHELELAGGYAEWAQRYDSLPSSFIQVEEPVLHGLLDGLPAGVALDAACGTGRQTAALLARGHRTIGVDQSPEMIARARERAPQAEFRTGRLEALPLDDDSVDLAVCTMALTHQPEVDGTVAELARVVRPGGRVLISDLHPFVIALQGQCIFVRGPGRLGFVRNHLHLPSAYLNAFTAAGLQVRSCHEPVFNGSLAPGGYEEFIADAARAAWDGLPLMVIWEAVVPA